MTDIKLQARAAAALTLAALAAACSNAPHPQPASATAQAVDRGEVEVIATLLDQGERGKAKKRVATALKRDPANASLMLLRDSIDRKPEELLGPNHFAYTVQSGDTMSGLAQRFLGNRLKSYQLARYNGLERPAALSAGQVLRIPAEPRAEPVRRTDKRSEPQVTASRPRPTQPAVMASPVRPRTTGNPAAARQARSAGLAALNEGNPERAVSLLSRAATLDPSNPAIARDLQRAQRINTTVKARQ